MSGNSPQELIRGWHNIRAYHRQCVLTLGSFDGVHRGHQKVLGQVVQQAKAAGLPACVMIFEPQPLEFLAPERAPARLMRFREKVQALFACGIQRVACLKFNKRLSELNADQFTKQILVDSLAVKHLIVGDDFRFGCDRQGDFQLLCQQGRDWGFDVTDTETHELTGERISSTRIRQALAEGDIGLATNLLGRPYAISGHVVYGNQLGRQLGLPTANIKLHRYRSPISGVFTVRARLEGQPPLLGVANVGRRPTIGGSEQVVLEVHLLNFSKVIYGEKLSVTFCHKLREERRFDSLDKLKQQILLDVEHAKQYFSDNP